MKIPEYEIVKEFKPHFPRNKILVYKKYFILYSPYIFQIYNSDDYKLFQEIDLNYISYLEILKEGYLIGFVMYNSEEINHLNVYKINI